MDLEERVIDAHFLETNASYFVFLLLVASDNILRADQVVVLDFIDFLCWLAFCFSYLVRFFYLQLYDFLSFDIILKFPFGDRIISPALLKSEELHEADLCLCTDFTIRCRPHSCQNRSS